MKLVKWGAAVAATVVLLLVLLLLLLVPPPPPPGAAGCAPGGGPPPVVPASSQTGGSAERNAATIVRVAAEEGHKIGLSDADIARAGLIGVMTAWREAHGVTLIGPHNNGSTSVGLFGQPEDWGPQEDRSDPERAARMFYTGGKGPGTPGLFDIRGWRSMELWEASHAVQRSSFPTAVIKHEGDARDLIARAGGVAPAVLQEVCPEPGGIMQVPGAAGTGACPATRFVAVEAGLQAGARRTVRCVAEAWPQIVSIGGRAGRANRSYHTTGEATDLMIPGWETQTGRAFGDTVAAWAITNADTLGISEVIWYDKIASKSRGWAWRPYKHPNCASIATCDSNRQHRNHIHLSIPQSDASVAT